MRAVRKVDTKPEIAVRSELHRLGYRFRKEHKVRAAGRKRSIDIAFPGDGLAVFVDGCFWHQCPEHGTVPKTNRGYWVPKLKRNVARDELVTASLKQSGWTVLRIWEHTSPRDAAALIAETLEGIRLRQQQSKEDKVRMAADLFAGAGGSTQGLKQAGYEVLAAVEFDAACAESYRKNHKGTELIERDITEVTPAQLLEAMGLRPGELDLLNACPPCQGFSSLGATDEDDHRNDLVSTVLEFISAIRPRAFILENVPGLERDRRLKALLSAVRTAGYGVKTYRLNATDFGVTQNRRRLIAIGIKGVDADELPGHPAELLPVSFRREHERITKVLAEAGPFQGTRDPIHRGRTATPEVAERIKLIPKNGGRFDLPEDHQLDCHKSLGSKRMDALGGGDLVSVAFANDRAEGDMIQGLLDSAGISSVLQQNGIDGPQLGIGLLNPGGGPQRVMVRPDQAEVARALLAEAVVPDETEDWVESDNSPYAEETEGRKPRNYGLIGAYGRIWAWSLGAMMLAFGVFLLLRIA